MKKLTVVLLSGIALMLSAQAYSQGKVEVIWQNSDKYTDVRSANESRTRFKERTFTQLEEYLTELAEALPNEQTLKITVTNLDLAGQVWPASFVGFGHSASDVRLIKSIDIPRIAFNYELLDSAGAVLQQGEQKLKDMSFQDRHNPFFSSETLRYEKNMLRMWFNEQFPQDVAKN
ncbi:MAG: DUF3016 domain-containing protein [Paraglaciecola polaris]|mgnify:FL=1|uniref:DUF3016 domain-containing protein n=1 Tax=Paraglaciecola polaris TaxID=222814 RepID=UPI003003020B|tara:strand:- start:8188 stop:8712 length:525 start_codon:yes stop_codon:yes gene_type:complete